MPQRWKAWKVLERVQYSGRNLIPWMVCIAVSGLIFCRTYYTYKFCPQYYYLHGMLGESLGWSRGSAAVLWVSCGLMLLPMCRNLLAFIRNKIPMFPGQLVRRFLDRNVWFHRACAVTTVVMAAIHTGAHLINGKRFSENYSDEFKSLNYAQYRDQDPLEFVLFSVAGSTGLAMMLLLLIMVAASTTIVRRSSYEVFWFTHHVFIIFYALLAVHGLGGVVKHQTNLDAHPPGCEQPHHQQTPRNKTVMNECQELAEFKADEPQAWKVIIAPLCIYMTDRLIRILRGYQQVHILKVVQHSCDVVELKMRKNGLHAKPGQVRIKPGQTYKHVFIMNKKFHTTKFEA